MFKVGEVYKNGYGDDCKVIAILKGSGNVCYTALDPETGEEELTVVLASGKLSNGNFSRWDLTP